LNDLVSKNHAKIVLGIDPGSQVTGFGTIRFERGSIVHLNHGVIAPPSTMDFNSRLAIIAGEIEALLERVRPDITVIEKVFLGKNADSAFKLGHARGVLLAAARRSGSEIVEYATRSVKKGVTGNGGATKEQVQTILFRMLGFDLNHPSIRFDASDALALAFYHARQMGESELIGQSLKREKDLEAKS
jgi:crossover junction endodeoxyribonuclease RuvC